VIRTTDAPRPVRHSVRHHLVALAVLTLALRLLAASGAALPAPPSDPGAWLDWWTATEPALALGAVLRLLAMGLCGYLLLLTTLDLLGLVLHWHPMSRLARRLAPAAWRAVVLRPVAMGTLAVPTLFAPALSAPPVMAEVAEVPDHASGEPITLTMTWVGPAEEVPPTTVSPTTVPPTTVPPSTVPPPAMPPTTVPLTDVPPTTEPGPPVPAPATLVAEPVDATAAAPTPPPTLEIEVVEATPSGTSTTAPSPAPTAPAPADETAEHLDAPPLGTPPGSQGAVHVVRPGESFWSIAEARAAAEVGRSPTANEVRLQWRALIAANEDRLPAPGNPDLLYPGMVLDLPTVGRAG
jgi:hypothetical protein